MKPGSRTSLKHVGGPAERRGDPELAAILERALDVGEGEAEEARAHVHGFHSYPARAHPVTAARLVRALMPKGGVFVDPFCGSGTLVVEARLAGVLARGTDINPLAIRLARLKVRGVPEVERRAIVDSARWVADQEAKRRAQRASPTHRYGPEDTSLFDPHVLLELDSIRDAIDRIEPIELRQDVELVFSAILTKASKRRGDSGNYLEARRLAPGFVARHLVAKAEELARALEVFERRLPPGAPAADVHSDDARVLGTIGAGSVDLVLTSPPYAATYDYIDHHDVRLRWLRVPIERFAELEFGARRSYATLHGKAAVDRWHDELGRALGAIGRALRPDGLAVMILADSGVAGLALRADEITEVEAAKVGLEVRAVVSQARPHFHLATRRAFSTVPRREHAIALRRRASPSVSVPEGEPPLA